LKQKYISALMTVCLLAAAVYLARTAVQYTTTWKKGDESSPVVLIDAGHGGEDPGKVGINGALEKEINLTIALLVKTYLEADGITVVLTRNSDAGLYEGQQGNNKIEDLKRRLALIDSSGAAVAVSIHQNSYTAESVHGAQVFYYETSQEGARLAALLQEQLRAGVEPENKRQPKSNTTYYLLKKSTAPTVIVECGFLSNGTEAEKLTQEEYQKKIAWNIALGIEQYLRGVQAGQI
jgi:N-acetylmuramoyl-L-alanine amidase